MRVPPDHPFDFRIFHYKPSSYSGLAVSPDSWKPPYIVYTLASSSATFCNHRPGPALHRTLRFGSSLDTCNGYVWWQWLGMVPYKLRPPKWWLSWLTYFMEDLMVFINQLITGGASSCISCCLGTPPLLGPCHLHQVVQKPSGISERSDRIMSGWWKATVWRPFSIL